ncbi:MAG: non-canonical purine NTP pyrophosphatase [Porphyromonadaceae bacterium CG2_30_38_12]|nr:MAG: non-canonical purine NTP pyrophosphatase [Porphyromonadaceae bacterium CG2_30_38_12]
MQQLVFATNNNHKLEEVRAILTPRFTVKSLSEMSCFDEIPETADTLEGNALLKATYIFDKYKVNCFADDTGLEVEALHGAPGVYSARYAGEENNADKNMQKLLLATAQTNNRKARFRTVIALILNGKPIYFEGIVGGSIALQPLGESGFGYDPIFIPDGFSLSFAQLGEDIKNKISHRAQAVSKLAHFLRGL